jgi:hypothetical protein
MTEKRPHELIQDMVRERAGHSDADILGEISRFPALADEGDPVWDARAYWDDVACLFVALNDIAAERKLRPAVRLLLERACNGDPGEMMRGIRHAHERIFDPDWLALADVCMDLATSVRPGTRMWAINQLMILDDPRARAIFERAMHDDVRDIRATAAIGLERLRRLST